MKKKYNTDSIIKKVRKERPKVVAQAQKQMNNEKELSAMKVLAQGHKAMAQAAKTEAKVAKDQLKAKQEQQEKNLEKARKARKSKMRSNQKSK